MTRISAPSTVLCIAAACLAAACAGTSEANVDEPPRRVISEVVEVGDAVDRVVLLGDLHGEREVRVFAQLPERIRVLHVEEGGAVSAGDPIATLSADLQSSGLEQASAAHGAAEAAADQLRTEISRARGLVSSGAMARSQLDTLEAQLRTSEAQVAQMRAARRTAGQQRSRTVVRAPIDGTVALLRVQEGDTVAPSMPICSVVQADSLVLRLAVTEQDYVRMREGMSAELSSPALPELRASGMLSRISPVLDPLTRTAQVEIAVVNADGALRPGMVAEARVELSRRPGVVLAASRALMLGARTDEDHLASVFVVEDGHASRREVRLGRRYGTRVEVAEGLSGGDEVVIEGQHLLRDGAAVRTTAPRTTAPRD